MNSIKEKIANDILKSINPLIKKFEKETDETKQVKIIHKAFEKELELFLKHLKGIKSKEFEMLMEELSDPDGLLSKYSETVDQLAFRRSESSQEFDKYNKRKKMEERHQQKLLEIIDDANLNKTGLERFVVFLILTLGIGTINESKRIIENLEWFDATNIVQNRLGFDHNWLVGMSLIQLHENLIKKKLSELKYNIQKDTKMPFLIEELGKLIEENEKRDIKLQLIMSQGLKHLRDKLSHAGYKYKITKSDLTKIIEEIKKLEKILYPNKNK